MAKQENFIGSWAFLIGVLLAIGFGAFGALTETMVGLLVAIGILVGFLNIAAKEIEPFLISGAVLIIASAFGQNVVSISPVFERILEALLLIFVPSTIVVSIRNVFELARR